MVTCWLLVGYSLQSSIPKHLYWTKLKLLKTKDSTFSKLCQKLWPSSSGAHGALYFWWQHLLIFALDAIVGSIINFRTQICISCLKRHLLETLSLIIKKKLKLKGRKKQKIKSFLQAFRETSLICLIYRTLIDHIQID